MNQVERSILAILDGGDIIVVDAGAAYGLPWHLRALAPIATVCYFEPDPDAAEELRKLIRSHNNSKARVFTTALAGTEGDRTLYVTNAPTGSSLLMPDKEVAGENPGYFYPIREITVHTRPLEAVLGEAGLMRVDTIKLDVQGAELEILEGLGPMLAADTLGAEMEIGFPGAYIDQPGFPELNALMTKSGFALYDMRLSSGDPLFKGRYGNCRRDIFRLPKNSTSLTKRIGETDAIYFRRVDQVLERRDAGMARRLMVLMGLYGFFIDALILADRARDDGILSPAQADSCRAALMAWHGATRDAVLDSLWFEKIRELACRISWKLQRKLLGREFYRWLA